MLSLAQKVMLRIRENSMSEIDKSEALRNAERLSDLFHDVKPTPYEFPIEEALGLPAFHNNKF